MPIEVTVPGDVTGIDFTLEPGSSISGHVYKSDGQTPLESAQIVAFGPDNRPCAIGWSVTDGSYTTTGLLAGDYTVEVQAEGYVPEWYDGVYDQNNATVLTITGDRSGIDFFLEEGATIEGTVVSTATGEGITGASVGVLDYDSLAGAWVGHGGATTDSQGHYVTSALPAGSYAVRVQTTGFITEFYDNAYSPDQAAEVILSDLEHKTGVDFSLEIGASISGRVLDKVTGGLVEDAGVGSIDLDAGWHKFIYRFEEREGASIAKAAFKAPGDADWRWFSTLELDIRTAPDAGAVSGITLITRKNTSEHPNNHWELVQCVDYDSVEEVGWSGQSVVNAVNQEQNIHGNDDYFTSYYEAYFYVDTPGIWHFATDSDDASEVVIDNQVVAYWYSGHPSAGRWEHKAVLNYSDNDSDTYISSLRTEPDGSYIIGDLPPGNYRIRGIASGYLGNSTVVTVAQGENRTDVDIALEPVGSISGTVYQSDNTTPIEGANISVYDYGTWISAGTATSQADGSYSVVNLASGDYWLMVEVPGTFFVGEIYDDTLYYDEQARVKVIAPNNTLNINFQLSKGGTLSGLVTDEANGVPIQRIWMHALDLSNGRWVGFKYPTDQDGSYKLGPLPAGNYVVWAHTAQTGYVPEVYDNITGKAWNLGTPVAVESLQDAPNINFALAIGGTISGHVYESDNTTPIANLYVRALDATTKYFFSDVRTDADGHYTLNGLATGSYLVGTRVSNTGLNYVDEWYDNVYNTDEATPVSVTVPDDTPNINFILDYTKVTIHAPANVVPGGDFTATIDISQVENFDAANYDVSFDATVLRLDDVTSGNIAGTEIPVAVVNEINPGTFIIVQNVPELPGVTGSGYLAVLHFNVIGSIGDSSNISLSNGVLANNLAEEIPATWTGDFVEVSVLPGDANGDGNVNAIDITKVERIIAGLDSPTPGADANQDGNINAIDITKVERIIAGLD